MFDTPAPFKPRPLKFAELVEHRGWRLKRYEIHAEGEELDREIYREGCDYGLTLLPEPAESAQRPGVGFLICHRGKAVDFLIVNWWDNQNELFQRVCQRQRPDGRWGPGEGSGSFCVWDAEVIWHERQAYVRHVLRERPDLEAYLRDVAPDVEPRVAAARD